MVSRLAITSAYETSELEEMIIWDEIRGTFGIWLYVSSGWCFHELGWTFV